jgi:steroid delta-isomerase-like uncharacterized protein
MASVEHHDVGADVKLYCRLNPKKAVLTYEPMSTPTDAVSLETAVNFAARFIEALNAHDAEGIVALTTDDVFWEDPYAETGSFRGHDGVRAFFAHLGKAFPELEHKLIDEVCLSTDGKKAAVFLRFSGTMGGALDPPGFAPTGTHGDVVIADFWAFRDGKLCHLRAFTDVNDLARQIGASPSPGSRGERVAVLLQRATARRLRRRAAHAS